MQLGQGRTKTLNLHLMSKPPVPYGQEYKLEPVLSKPVTAFNSPSATYQSALASFMADSGFPLLLFKQVIHQSTNV